MSSRASRSREGENTPLSRTSYPSDLTDQEWAILVPLIPSAKPGGRPRTVAMREIIKAFRYVMRTGCAWRLLPHDLPPWHTVDDYFRIGRNEGVWEQLHTHLWEQVRVSQGRQATPSAASIDSQSVKTTEKGGPRLRRGEESEWPQTAPPWWTRTASFWR